MSREITSPAEQMENEELCERDNRLNTIRWSNIEGPYHSEVNTSQLESPLAGTPDRLKHSMSLLSQFSYVSPCREIYPKTNHSNSLSNLESIKKAL